MAGRRNSKDASRVIDRTVATVNRVKPVGNQQRTIRRHGNVCRSVVVIHIIADQIDDTGGIAGTSLLRRKRPHPVAAGLGMNHLPVKLLRQQIALIDKNSGRSPRTCNEQIGHHTGIVLVPHTTLHGGFNIRAPGSIVRTSFLVTISIIAVFHHEVHTAGTQLVVVVRLPHRTKGINGHLPVIAEVVSKHFNTTAIHFAPNDHPFLIRLATVVDGITKDIFDQRSIRATQFRIKVAEVEVEPSIWPEHHRMDRMVMLPVDRVDHFPNKQDLLLVSLVVAIGICDQEYSVGR